MNSELDAITMFFKRYHWRSDRKWLNASDGYGIVLGRVGYSDRLGINIDDDSFIEVNHQTHRHAETIFRGNLADPNCLEKLDVIVSKL